MKFEKNVSARDAQIRTILGAVVIVIALFFVENPWAKIVLAVVAAVLAATGYFHSCYLYKFLKKNTGKDTAVGEESPAPVAEAAAPSEPASEETPESEKVS